MKVYFTSHKIYLFHVSNSSSVYFWLLGIIDRSFSLVWPNDTVTYFWFCQVLITACGIFSCVMGSLGCSRWDLVPWPGIKPGPPALGTWSLSPWTTREALMLSVWLYSFRGFLMSWRVIRCLGTVLNAWAFNFPSAVTEWSPATTWDSDPGRGGCPQGAERGHLLRWKSMASKSILRERKQSNEFSDKQKLSHLPLVDTQKYHKDVDMAERLTLTFLWDVVHWYSPYDNS